MSSPDKNVGKTVHAKKSWATVGVSENVIEASWLALVDAMRLELMRLTVRCPLHSPIPLAIPAPLYIRVDPDPNEK